jgi:hypothetical protein
MESGLDIAQTWSPAHSRDGFYSMEATVTDYSSTEFIVGVDEDENLLTRSCNPDLLSMKEYVASIWFGREVLDKYRWDPFAYRLEKDRVSQGKLWSLRFFRNWDLVGVCLGDLGRDLPDEEREHWRQHNIFPLRDVPQTSIGNKDQMFQAKFVRMQKAWMKRFGWALFRPVSNRVMSGIRLPYWGMRRRNFFERTINCLCRAMIGSINVAELARIARLDRRGADPIETLHAWLRYRGGADPTPHIIFLIALGKIQAALAEGARPPDHYTAELNNIFDCALELVDFLVDSCGLWPPEE